MAASMKRRWKTWLMARTATVDAHGGEMEGLDPDLTEWCAEKARGLHMQELACKVKVRWNTRMRTAAGRAWWPGCVIELNPGLKDCEAAELSRTLKHELAHLLAYGRNGRRRIKPHGPEWRQACADLGIPGESTRHSLPFEPRRMKRGHLYSCPSCHAAFSRVRKIRTKAACFACCREFNGGRYHERFQLVVKTSEMSSVDDKSDENH